MRRELRSQRWFRRCRADTQVRGRRCERAAQRAQRRLPHRAVAVVVVAAPRRTARAAAGSPVAPAVRGVEAAVVVGGVPVAAVLVAVAVQVVGRVALVAQELPEVRLAVVVAVVVGARLAVEVWV